MKEAEKR